MALHETAETFSFVSHVFWSVYGVLRLYFIRFLDAMTQNATHCHHILFSLSSEYR